MPIATAPRRKARREPVDIHLPRHVCADPQTALAREWIVTNGLGGYAFGTVAGALTRRYHGLLIAALKPPTGRYLLAAKIDETLRVGDQDFALYTNVWGSGLEQPPGCRFIERFDLLDGVPTWRYAAGGATLTKRIWMELGENTTYVQYELDKQSPAAELSTTLLVNWRDHHQLTPFAQHALSIEPINAGLRVRPPDAAECLEVRAVAKRAASVAWTQEHDWYRDFQLNFEESVGYEHREDHLCAGRCRVALKPGESVTFVLAAAAASQPVKRTKTARTAPSPAAALRRRNDYAAGLLAAARESGALPIDAAPPAVRQLILAADQFVVARPLTEGPGSKSVERASLPAVPTTNAGRDARPTELPIGRKLGGHTIIAGYPWFTDWGRDTMISLPGLTLCTGRFEIAREILRTWARYVDRGMIPNRFPDSGEQPEYNTADATLWYLWAINAYFRQTGDRDTLAELYPIMNAIVEHHLRGTRYNIHVAEDGLLYAGEPGVQLTWMDAKVDGRVITPRIGKPVELSALWHTGLRNLAELAGVLGKKDDARRFGQQADRTKASFARFWNAERGCCYDVLDGPDGADARVQANQIFAVSLEHELLARAQARAVVEVCQRDLLTWFGLRTLAPGESRYHGRYQGRLGERDEAYHQGTAWAWLLGPFVIAHYRVHHDAAAARRFLEPLLGQLWVHALGTLAEISDGDEPHHPRGCAAQAWSVAETLRAWQVTQNEE